MQLAGDYGGSNAAANRQAALSRYGPVGSGLGAGLASGASRAASYTPPPKKATGTITTGPSGKYSRPAAPPAVAPGPMQTDPNAWLGADVGYQDLLRQLALASTNFNADFTRRQGDVNSQYDTSNKALHDQSVIDLKNLEADYAGRGLIRSGLYANAVGDYNKELDQRLAELLSGRDRTLAQLTQEQQQFQTQQQLDQQRAREDALRRRASGLGV